MLIAIASLLGACAPDRLIVDKDWIPKRVTGNFRHFGDGVYGPANLTIEFRNREQVRSDIVELDFIGQLKARDGAPFNIYSGKRCHNCESNRAIYIHSPTEGRMTTNTMRLRYPGRLYSRVDGSLVEENRVFFGDCLPGYSAATMVWFTRTRLDRVGWQDQVTLVESQGTSLRQKVLKDPAPLIDSTLDLVEQDRCREIPGAQLSTEP